MKVAALFVENGGCYYGLPDVDQWDEARDARRYAGPWPVVAHPPCQRWGKLWAGQPLFIKRTGIRKKKGDDGGCFAAALAAARRFGGITRHRAKADGSRRTSMAAGPAASSRADMATTLASRRCCMRLASFCRSWIGASVNPAWTPPSSNEWGWREQSASVKSETDSSPRIGTPEPFRDLLLSIARTAAQRVEKAA